MAKATLEWNPEAVLSVDVKADRFAEKLAVTLKNMTKESMGTSGFPRIITGRLKESIGAFKISKNLYKVSSDAPYAAHVELGTSRSAPYPYFRPNINRLKSMVSVVVE